MLPKVPLDEVREQASKDAKEKIEKADAKRLDARKKRLGDTKSLNARKKRLTKRKSGVTKVSYININTQKVAY